LKAASEASRAVRRSTKPQKNLPVEHQHQREAIP
jgi:hypothetical protein